MFKQQPVQYLAMIALNKNRRGLAHLSWPVAILHSNQTNF